MPKWKPGKQKGQAVNVQFAIPVTFRIPAEKTPKDTPAKTTTQKPVSGKVYDMAQQAPEFPGGENALMAFLSKNVKYPKEAFENKIEGKVLVEMIIDKEGNTTQARISKGTNPYLDKEALRVANSMPKWKPGRENGQAVNVKYTFPIQFKLQ